MALLERGHMNEGPRRPFGGKILVPTMAGVGKAYAKALGCNWTW